MSTNVYDPPEKKNNKTDSKSAWINGICIIIAAIIGIFSFNINSEKDDLIKKYEKIYLENTDLKAENSNLQNQIISLTEENELLKSNSFSSKGDISNASSENIQLTNSELSSKKVSIFNLETFKGTSDWKQSGDSRWYTDTYGNEYLTSHYANHYTSIYEEENYIPTYLLDNKYSLCEGQIAWSKLSKDYDGTAWIEFYSGDDCIYITDPITADSRVLTFSFSVEGIEKLTIVRKGTKNGYQTSTLCIIYPYLNLIE